MKITVTIEKVVRTSNEKHEIITANTKDAISFINKNKEKNDI